jgi:hypothetical protein
MVDSSRRNFLAAGLAPPVAGKAMPQAPQSPARGESKGPSAGGRDPLEFRTLGKTGQRVTAVDSPV